MRFNITVQRRTPWWHYALAIAAGLLIVRLLPKVFMPVLVLTVLLGPAVAGAVVAVVLVVALAAWREHKAGRNF